MLSDGDNCSIVKLSYNQETTKYDILSPYIANILLLYCNEQPSQATETPSVEKHAHPPRVVYCAIYPTLTQFTKL